MKDKTWLTWKKAETFWLLSHEAKAERDLCWGYKKYTLSSQSAWLHYVWTTVFAKLHNSLPHFHYSESPIVLIQSECLGVSSFPPSMWKGSLGLFKGPRNSLLHPSELAHPEETAQRPCLVTNSLSSRTGPGSLSFLKTASDTACTWWSCAGTWWSSSGCGWPFWESGVFSSAWGRTSSPSRCLGLHFWSSTSWASWGAARSAYMSSAFSRCPPGQSSSQASFPSEPEAALPRGWRGQCAAERCFRRGRYLYEPKRCSCHVYSSKAPDRCSLAICNFVLRISLSCSSLGDWRDSCFSLIAKMILFYVIIG